MNSIKTLKSRFQLLKNEFLKKSFEIQSLTSGVLNDEIRTAFENDLAGLKDRSDMLNVKTVEDLF